MITPYWGGPHGTGVFKDPQDPDPARRYKAIFKGEILSVAFSPDGIHWGDIIPCPEADVAGDTHNNALWAPSLNTYVGFTRSWGEKYGRQVARIESDDFVTWTEAKVVLEGKDKKHQTYSMPVFYHGGVYLGLVAIHDQEEDRVWTELTWSPDTKTWHRVLPGTPLIPNSEEEGAYDWGCVYAAACPVFLKDEIRLYYGGSDGHHFGWRNGFFCLATLRPDGFAGYTQSDPTEPATLTTTSLVYRNRPLRVCADVDQAGFVTVSVLDEQDEPLARSEPLSGKLSDAQVVWRDEFSLDALEEQQVRLRFEFEEATIYSFSFAE